MFPNIDLKQLTSLVVRELKSLRGNQKLSIADLQDGEEIKFMLAKAKNGGSKRIDTSDQRYHGGGDTVAAGTNITITTLPNGQKQISATAASAIATEPISGTQSGSDV